MPAREVTPTCAAEALVERYELFSLKPTAAVQEPSLFCSRASHARPRSVARSCSSVILTPRVLLLRWRPSALLSCEIPAPDGVGAAFGWDSAVEDGAVGADAVGADAVGADAVAMAAGAV